MTTAPQTPAEERVLERFLEKRAAKQAARDEKGQQYRTYLRWSGKALEIPLSVVVGLLLGMYLEKQFDFAPWGTWGGLFFGVSAAVRAMYRLIKVYQRENPDEPDDQSDNQGDNQGDSDQGDSSQGGAS
jgi:F0F1-type ATP synthase assembly protein I